MSRIIPTPAIRTSCGEGWTPLVLLTVDDGAGRAEYLHERDNAQDNEYGPDDLIALDTLRV